MRVVSRRTVLPLARANFGARNYAVGQSIKSSSVVLKGADNADVKVSDYFSGKKVVLFGVPGAFTPVCSNQHVPSFQNQADALKAKGVDKVACLSVNDSFVMKAWKASTNADKVDMLGDWSAGLTKELGLDVDLSAAGLGVRCKRFAMIVDDGKVTFESVEEAPSKFEVTSAEAILKQL
eukprot:CAMPEP_0174260200 /NCGR_PEP_ID=MMETSP0439-20130205/9221_1 /TAXON_ID=0 /ORGANISM="Stereomyxa ramosa, Strain Chinc5" /LENGTH=178 /DNA_ID=CAMNT_0015344393 /DNA_START=8 /DNA_END=544 /DNA_ORIENTATION=+